MNKEQRMVVAEAIRTMNDLIDFADAPYPMDGIQEGCMGGAIAIKNLLDMLGIELASDMGKHND